MPSVFVKNGNFQVILQGLGDNAVQLETAVKDLDAAYVEIRIGNELPLVPRQPLLRSPFSSSDKVVGKADVLIQSDSQSAGTGIIAMRIGSSDRVTILNNGNVGIGTITPTSKLEVNGRIKDQTGYLTPVGTIIAYASVTPPQGWLYCNGQSVLKDAYIDLFTVIGCTFGCDASTFQLPDLRGEFIRGFDDGSGVDTDRLFGNWQADTVGAHSHNYYRQYGGQRRGREDRSAAHANSFMATTEDNPTGETRPRNVALPYMIKH